MVLRHHHSQILYVFTYKRRFSQILVLSILSSNFIILQSCNFTLVSKMSATPVCLITAGSAGLGAATARLFATAGYRVAINYHSNNERAKNVVEELEKLSTLSSGKDSNFMAIKADVSKREEITRLVDEAVSAMGRLDVVYSNHGWTEIRGLESLDVNVIEDDWDRCYNMNVKSHLWLMHAAKPHLDETEGAFITTASLAGVRASGSSLVNDLRKITVSGF